MLKCIYAETTVTRILSGKAISRAVCGHLLTNAILNALIICQAYGISITTHSSANEMVFDDSTDSETQPHLLFQETSSELKEKVIAGFMTAEQVQTSSLLESVTNLLKTAKESLSSSRTAKLWLQYMEMVDILCDFIKAERTGNWLLHLSVVRSM